MEQLVNFVIRPPRAEYDPSTDLLQPEFTLKGRRYKREDKKVTNQYGHKLECSHYMPIPMTEEKPLPCVIYCHGNSGCRGDASEAAVILLPSNITVFSLDFSGSGLSEGEYVTLGWNEKADLKSVVEYLRTDKRISCIGLWGRSMGAVTCLLYGAEDPSIAGMVLDSPFSNLVDLMMELVDVYKVRLPKFTLKVAIQYMRKVIQKKARFDIMDLDAVQVAKRSFIPALFGHATEDSFIQPHHSDLIYKAYLGDKNIIKFEGDHNSPRPRFYYDSINIFFHNVLQPPEGTVADVAPVAYYGVDDMEENIWYQVLRAMQPSFSPDVAGLAPGLMEDGLGWHMSRTEVPADLGDLQEDMSKLLSRENINDTPSGSSNFQLYGDDEEMFTRSAGHVNGAVDLASTSLEHNFPSTAEDEERMLMEAIALSLQTNDTQPSGQNIDVHGDKEPLPVSNAPEEASHTSCQNDADNQQSSVQAPPSTITRSRTVAETQTMGTLEALGQRLGLGFFRATTKEVNNQKS